MKCRFPSEKNQFVTNGIVISLVLVQNPSCVRQMDVNIPLHETINGPVCILRNKTLEYSDGFFRRNLSDQFRWNAQFRCNSRGAYVLDEGRLRAYYFQDPLNRETNPFLESISFQVQDIQRRGILDWEISETAVFLLASDGHFFALTVSSGRNHEYALAYELGSARLRYSNGYITINPVRLGDENGTAILQFQGSDLTGSTFLRSE